MVGHVAILVVQLVDSSLKEKNELGIKRTINKYIFVKL